MSERQALLDSIWQGLAEMPRMKVNALLAQMGLSKSMYAKLEDEQTRKLALGLFTRLDDSALEEAVSLVQH